MGIGREWGLLACAVLALPGCGSEDLTPTDNPTETPGTETPPTTTPTATATALPPTPTPTALPATPTPTATETGTPTPLPPTPTTIPDTPTDGPTPTDATVPPTPTFEPFTPPPAGASNLWVGAGWATLLPTVDGTTTYFDPLRAAPLALEPGDPGDDPGVFVRQWDVGTIGIGNGFPSSHWVHDEIRATAVAFQDRTREDGEVVVLVGADLYMLFRNDLDVVDGYIQEALGAGAFSRLRIVYNASHTHEGPDTAGLDGPVNHDYYDYMAQQMATAVVDAVKDLAPATLKANTSNFQFGLGDTYAPYIVDPTLNTLQALHAETGDVIATVVQWSNHPEVVLFYDAPVQNAQHCNILQAMGEAYEYDDDGDEELYTCTFEGQYISADFPGIMATQLMDTYNAPALYLNGTVGSLMTPLRIDVWEVDGPTGKPLGDGLTVPEGAEIVPRNFRKMSIVGQELAKQVIADLAAAEEITNTTVTHNMERFYTRLTNVAFRIGLAPRPGAGEVPLLLGHTLRELYTCDVEKTECIFDEFATELDPVYRIPRRVGNYLRSEVHHIRLGDVEIMTAPAEMAPELANGLPSDFYTNDTYYPSEDDLIQHVSGEDYTIVGYTKAAMSSPYKWILGLANDELGYMVPLSDYRIRCVVDDSEFADLELTCAGLFERGVIQFPDAVSGTRCAEVFDGGPAALAGLSQADAQGLLRSCQYGQTSGDVRGHYPETNSAGWDMEADYFEVLQSLTGFEGPWEMVNPDFTAVNQ